MEGSYRFPPPGIRSEHHGPLQTKASPAEFPAFVEKLLRERAPPRLEFVHPLRVLLMLSNLRSCVQQFQPRQGLISFPMRQEPAADPIGSGHQVHDSRSRLALPPLVVLVTRCPSSPIPAQRFRSDPLRLPRTHGWLSECRETWIDADRLHCYGRK